MKKNNKSMKERIKNAEKEIAEIISKRDMYIVLGLSAVAIIGIAITFFVS